MAKFGAFCRVGSKQNRKHSALRNVILHDDHQIGVSCVPGKPKTVENELLRIHIFMLESVATELGPSEGENVRKIRTNHRFR